MPCLGRMLGVALAAMLAGAAAGAESPVGRWITEGGKSHVEIYACGAQLCGRIAWLRQPLSRKTGQPLTDGNNPDPALRARPILGLPFLWNFTPSAEPRVWADGRVYNPEDGEVYRGTMTLQPDGRLRLRGYIGISLLGRSQVWERVR